MAIAPVNKFVNIAVPVAPGAQKLYEVPTGTTSLLLYAQVANVGINTYPTITFLQRRVQRSTENTRDIRVLKDVEIPPNDAVILVDGRMVLEKTPLVLDQIYITGTQENVGIITGVTYDEPTGIATVMCKEKHNFSVDDPITMGGIYFTCTGSTGITTNIFPDPQQSYNVVSIVDNVGTSKTFSAFVGSSKGYTHVYESAKHRFIRALPGAVEVVSTTQTTSPHTGQTNLTATTGTTYNPTTGVMSITTTTAHGLSDGDLIKILDNTLTFTCNAGQTDHTYAGGTAENAVTINAASTPVQKDVTNATYDTLTGDLVLTIGSHTFTTSDTCTISTESIKFTCKLDNDSSVKAYPRQTNVSGNNDPAYLQALAITAVAANTITVNVGPVTASSQNKTYPRSTDPISGKWVRVSNTTTNTFEIQVLDITPSTDTSTHTFVSAIANSIIIRGTVFNVSDADYNSSTGEIVLTIGSNTLLAGDTIRIAKEHIVMSCTMDNHFSEHPYPRAGDPAYNADLSMTIGGTGKIRVNVGKSHSGGFVAPLQMEFTASVLENSNV
tara:strand:- start:6036 stop:7697 length:1662 start_codon:yes stop_codon:yes gene_type:complete